MWRIKDKIINLWFRIAGSKLFASIYVIIMFEHFKYSQIPFEFCIERHLNRKFPFFWNSSKDKSCGLFYKYSWLFCTVAYNIHKTTTWRLRDILNDATEYYFTTCYAYQIHWTDWYHCNKFDNNVLAIGFRYQ